MPLVFLPSCQYIEPVEIYPEHLPHLFTNLALEELEKLQSDTDYGKEHFKKHKKPILRAGKLILYTNGKIRFSDKEKEEEPPSGAKKRYRTSTSLKVNNEEVMIEFSFKW